MSLSPMCGIKTNSLIFYRYITPTAVTIFFSCQAKTFQVIYYYYHFLFTPGTLNYCSTSAKSYIVLYL